MMLTARKKRAKPQKKVLPFRMPAKKRCINKLFKMAKQFHVLARPFEAVPTSAIRTLRGVLGKMPEPRTSNLRVTTIWFIASKVCQKTV
jgi:hypothetical protein